MDEGTLNDLLECSVCLERLDTSSKVLPCQHTFCKKCLEEIVDRHKELRCPECRVLVPIKIDDLPPNVLLMRILEGMRNSAPKKPAHKSVKTQNATNIFHNANQTQTAEKPSSNKPPHQHQVYHPHQTYAKALYDYSSKEVEDLNFKRGDMIVIKKRIDNNWYQGECNGKIGVFPLSYVQVITPLPSNIPQCKALYDFRMTNDDEEGCLTFNKGDVISVIRRVDENWAEGKLNGRIGIFPLAFVELNNLARSLMKLSTNAQPGPSRVAPPTPTVEDNSAPLIPTDHSRNVGSMQFKPRQGQTVFPNLPQNICDSSSNLSSGSSSTTTPNTSSSNTSSTSSTAPSSPASPPSKCQVIPSRSGPMKLESNAMVTTPQRQLRPDAAAHNREKRHSFTSLSVQHLSQQHANRLSAEISSSDHDASSKTSSSSIHKSPVLIVGRTLPAPYVALYPYKPQKPDELELKKGSIYIVTERCQDGWFKGTSNRTQKCGVFPGNYVALAQGLNSPVSSSRAEQNSPRNQAKSLSGKTSSLSGLSASLGAVSGPPELPPRSVSPRLTEHHTNHSLDEASVPCPSQSHIKLSNDKIKDRREKGSLMKRLASIKRSKSPPPPTTYSMDNPVFEDSSVGLSTLPQPVHVRSGSCPTQLLTEQQKTASHRIKHKERPVIARVAEPSPSVPHTHRKSNSLDAGRGQKVTRPHERFRVIAPYPPNSEYELELRVDDVIYVHKKRDDGWYKGLQPRTGRTGLFPASFVENF